MSEKVRKLNKSKLPRHVAIIMDGNGRWAKEKGLPRVAGHRAGAQTVRGIVRTSREIGIEILTLYAFSVENWKRPRREVDALMKLLREFLKKELKTLNKNEIRLKVIGRLEELPPSVRDSLKETMEKTAGNHKLLLNLAINYGGRSEIIDAVKDITMDVREGKFELEKLNEETFKQYLYTSDLPDPDLLIRTSGEYRLSNFLLYQLSYSEIWITSVYWPDFKKENFIQALLDYQDRKRRFGSVSDEK